MQDHADVKSIPSEVKAFKPEPPPNLLTLPTMVSWYGPRALWSTALRAIVSATFGQYADQRVMQAAVDYVHYSELIERYNYSALPPMAGTEGVWVDYIADTGDGFDSTYAIASLAAEPMLTVEGANDPLPAGQLLVMGGDQVYPSASTDLYRERFINTMRLTTHFENFRNEKPKRPVFLLPGNHDWYDGLNAFDELFCRARDTVSPGLIMGRWRCVQHRSYFAIRLPHNWWIWGLDIQLSQNIDVGQVQYFRWMAQHMKDLVAEEARLKAEAEGIASVPVEQPKVIVVIAEPSWHHGAAAGSTAAYPNNLQKLLNMAIDEATVCAVIAGDLHHYSRYFGTETGVNLITSGGGGAYLAPTHALNSELMVPWRNRTHHFTLRSDPGRPFDEQKGAAKTAEEAVYPSRKVCNRLSWRLLLFPFLNPTFAFGLGFFYWLMAWFYSIAQLPDELKRTCTPIRNKSTPTIGEYLRAGCGNDLTWTNWFTLPLEAATSQPALAGMAILLFVALLGFSSVKRRFWRIINTAAHWSAHILAIVLISAWSIQINPVVIKWLKDFVPGMPTSSAIETVLSISFFITEQVVIGGFVGGLIWGIYLFISCRWFKTITDLAFSALRIANYKNFLRLHVTKDKVTIYPIGLDRVPHRYEWRAPKQAEHEQGVVAAFLPTTPLKPRLIEPPIVIEPKRVRDI